MEKLINPLFVGASNKKIITAGTKMPREQDMIRCQIVAEKGKMIPVLVDLNDRIVIPVKK